MKLITFFFILLFISSCSKTKTVLICGDHVCVNKAEAKQYFEENLSLEVKIVNQKLKKEVDLIELNLKKIDEEKKEIKVIKKEITNKNIKILSNKEKKDIKNNIKKKNKQKRKKITKKIDKDNIKKKKNKKIRLEQAKLNKEKKNQKKVNNKENEIEDICSLLEKCNIDEISRYLLKKGKEKNFPDITKRPQKL